MNYLKESIAFNDYLLTNRLSAGQIALWHALFGLCNRTGWKKEFTVPVSILHTLSGLSTRAVFKNRDVLAQHGLISYRSNEGFAATYTVHSVRHLIGYDQWDKQSAAESTPQSAPQSAPHSSPYSAY